MCTDTRKHPKLYKLLYLGQSPWPDLNPTIGVLPFFSIKSVEEGEGEAETAKTDKEPRGKFNKAVAKQEDSCRKNTLPTLPVDMS